jgi:hypothetical protein
MELTAPLIPGKYCAFFRFVHGNSERFGQKTWADILVEDTHVVEIAKIIIEEPVPQ